MSATSAIFLLEAGAPILIEAKRILKSVSASFKSCFNLTLISDTLYQSSTQFKEMPTKFGINRNLVKLYQYSYDLEYNYVHLMLYDMEKLDQHADVFYLL